MRSCNLLLSRLVLLQPTCTMRAVAALDTEHDMVTKHNPASIFCLSEFSPVFVYAYNGMGYCSW